MESAGEKAEVPVQSTAAPSEAEKPAENIDPEPQPTTADPSAGVKVRHIFTYHISALDWKKSTNNKDMHLFIFPNELFQFKALFSYGGQHDDELCFETGDIITLISKVSIY